MAARRRKTQARRGNERRIPVWLWLLGGVLIGLGLSAAVLIWERDGRLPGPRPNPAATARELGEAKRQLASNGVPDTLAVREAIP